MPKIALIDDRSELRVSLRRNIDTCLPDTWELLDIDPFSNIDEYPQWIINNKIVAILLDERLNERLGNTATRVSYRGHDLVDSIRNLFPNLPVFIVTSFVDDEDLTNRFGNVDDIIHRRKFSEKTEDYISRVVRAAMKFRESHEEELSSLSDYAAKIACGTASPSEIKAAKAICESLNIPLFSETFLKNAEILTELEGELGRFQSLINDIKKQKDS